MANDVNASGEMPTGIAPPFRPLFEPPAAAPMVQVAGYEIVAELGRGGMGVVYQARQCSLKRLVALKMILTGLHADAAARARFRTEAEAVARLQHPNIVQIHEVSEDDGKPFLALEYVDGGNLLRKVAGAAQPERAAARLVETLARAVHYMHQRGILHRDLKPTNVLLSCSDAIHGVQLGTSAGQAAYYEPKIADFGLAKILDADTGPTRSAGLLGTPSYMAPEQAAGDPQKVGVAADVYALGAILYELLTGRAPFLGATPLSTLEQVRTQEPVPPRRLRRAVSLELETICMKCLHKEPARRYATAEALADDLHRFLQGEPIAARPVPRWQRQWRALRRRPALLAWALTGVAVAGLVLSAGSYFLTTKARERQRAEDKYRQFVECRDEALLRGLLAPDEGALFLGATPAAHLQTAESATRQALILAGVDLDSESAAVATDLPAVRKAEVAADCYALLLALAGLQGQQARDRDRLRILDRARALGFETRAYHLRRADVLEQRGDPQAARNEKERAAALPPQGALDHFLAGEDAYRRGEWAQAVNSFNQALGVQPGHFWAQFFLAICELKLQRPEAARAGLNACLAQQPNFVWAYLFRSYANEKLRALDQAEADFQQALELGPNEHARYVLFLSRGIRRFHQKQLEQAATDFRAAMALKPEQYNAYLNLAHVYLAQRQFEQAAEQVRAALPLHPPALVVVGYHVERGRHLLREDRYEEALQASADGVALSPDQPAPYEIRGRALLALGRYEPAEQSFEQYLRLGGEATTDVFRCRGLARMKLAKYADAVDDYTQALALAPDADIFEHRGWAHFFSDAWKLALRDFSKSIELDAEAGDAYTGRGLARVMLGQYREAVVDAETALERKPRTPEMMHNIACTFAQAVARAEADLQSGDRQLLAERYRRRALAAVRDTLAMVSPSERRAFWQNKIVPDAALAPIFQEVEFKRLQEEYLRLK
jgi:tetratricopeptide (TPR) repeat protein